MATLDELPLRYRLLLRAYPWRVLDPVPWTALRQPLEQARIALVTSAGLYRRGVDAPFKPSRGGDPSVRWLGTETPVEELVLGQTSDAFDHAPLERDLHEAWPIDVLSEAVRTGRLGSLNRMHLSFNGSMTAPGRFLRDQAPAVAARFTKDAVDAVLLVPV